MGFFSQKRERYRLNLPGRLNVAVVKAAALNLAGTEDRKYWLHPEQLLTTMSRDEIVRREPDARFAR